MAISTYSNQDSYTYERSNELHKGLTVMQDGDIALMPYEDFKKEINFTLPLFVPKNNQELFTFIITGLGNTKENEEMAEELRTLVRQLHPSNNFVHAIKISGGQVVIPDFNYFNSEYEKIQKELKLLRNQGASKAEIIKERNAKANKLARDFRKCLQTSAKENLDEAKNLGIDTSKVEAPTVQSPSTTITKPTSTSSRTINK